MSDNVITLRRDVPKATVKKVDRDDPQRHCEHREVEIWEKSQILECARCKAIVDPYQWLRKTVGRWQEIVDAEKRIQQNARDETEDLKKALRLLRREYKDEVEKRHAEAMVRIPAPIRRV